MPSNEHEAVFYKFLEKTGNVEASADESVPVQGAEQEVSVPADLLSEAILR